MKRQTEQPFLDHIRAPSGVVASRAFWRDEGNEPKRARIARQVLSYEQEVG